MTDAGVGARVAKEFSLVGPAGRSPIAPGSVGALFAIPLAWWLAPYPLALRLFVTCALIVVSFPMVTRYLRSSGGHDPQEIVVDELVGCLIPLVVFPFSWVWVTAGYVAFRFFDIVKPWPIRLFERSTKGALSIVGDDVLAGIAATLLLFVLQFVAFALALRF